MSIDGVLRCLRVDVLAGSMPGLLPATVGMMPSRLSADGANWWASEKTARRKLAAWVGEAGCPLSGPTSTVRIALITQSGERFGEVLRAGTG